MPSPMPLRAPSDTAAWLELFEQPERVSPVTEPLIKPLRYRRALREILATGPRTIGEAAYGIADMLGLQALVYHEEIRNIVGHLGMKQAWALAVQVLPLPLQRRRQAFLDRVRHTQAPPDAAQKS
jgi:hypothetical protein